MEDLKKEAFRNSEKINFFRDNQIYRINDHDNLIEDHSCRIKSHENQVATLRQQIYSLRSVEDEKNIRDQTDRKQIFHTIKDAYSFIMVRPLSPAAFIAWLIFIVQTTSFFLVILNLCGESNGNACFMKLCYFSIPKRVDPTVHVSQTIAIYLIILVQQSLWESLSCLSHGYNNHLKAQGVTYIWWLISNLLRLIEGLVAAFVTFMLVLQSENVVDLFENFMAMTFVSSLDNLIYLLADMNVIESHMSQVVKDCETITYREIQGDEPQNSSDATKSHRNIALVGKYIFRPLFISLFLLIIMYTVWAKFVLIPHMNGDYLCQSFYLQLDDNVNSELSFFSGSYDLLQNNMGRGSYFVYRESKYSINYDERRAMILRYCDNIGSWVFALERKEVEDECDIDSVYLKSLAVANQEKYDLLEVPIDDWVVKQEDTRMIPLQDFRITCQDNVPKYSQDTSNVCEKIEIDERDDPFVSTRSWSTAFSMMKHESNNSAVLVYDHPVYISSDTNDGQDIILYVGKRWTITSTGDFMDFNEIEENSKDKTSLKSYLRNQFHGKWSEYKVAFFSESALIDTPQDTMTPVGLNWFAATSKVKCETQSVDEKYDLSSILLCTLCNEKSNPCYYNGTCHNDQTCGCTLGSSGSLCQVPPTSNGLCDEYFNTREFDYDGGDCCLNTCVSGKKHTCGTDKTNLVYIGYDTCVTESCKDDWRENESSPTLRQLIVTYVSLSESGRVLALIESASQTVRIYDSDGSNWIMRGLSVKNSIQPTLDSVQISGYNFVMNNREQLSLITVAVMSNANVYIYDWNEILWEEKDNGVFKNPPDQSHQMELRNNGKSLGILYKDGSFRLFERAHYSKSWKETKKHIAIYTNFFSMSEDGSTYVLANQSCIEVHNHQEMVREKCLNSKIIKINISSGGQTLAVLVAHEGIAGYIIYRYDISNKNLKQIDGPLRGLTTGVVNFEITNDGMTVALHSGTDNTLRFYEWENNHSWQVKQKEIVGESMFLSSDETTLAMISSKQNVTTGSSDLVNLYHRDENCGTGMSNLRLTFISDMFPRELSWEIIKVTLSDNVTVLRRGGAYETADTMIVERVCVSNEIVFSTNDNVTDSCIGIKITDLGLNGLRSPGVVGISINGEVIWSVNSTDGYEDIFPVLGNNACMDSLREHTSRRKKYSDSMHADCFTASCEWKEIGEMADGLSSIAGYNNNYLSLSSDGSVLAIGNYFVNDITGQVSIFKYSEDGGWSPLGVDLNGVREGDGFGYAVDLSADGSIVAIGVPGVNTYGQVHVYFYNEMVMLWSQLGDAINGHVAELVFGTSVSLSADGATVAVGVGAMFLSQTVFHASVYHYNVKEDKWIQRGNYLDGIEAAQKSLVDLSSTGSILVVGTPWSGDFEEGHVKVFEYDDVTKQWAQLGQRIEGDDYNQNFGASISISSDGSILAIGGSFSSRANVYKYRVDEQEWQQLGQDIIPDGSIRSKITNLLIDVTLSADGSVLVCAWIDLIELLLYDESRDFWVSVSTTFPSIVSPDSFNYRTRQTFVVSADATTIAITRIDNAVVYQLVKNIGQVSSCQGNQPFFNFTIQPDQFPQDIIWSLENDLKDIITGTRLHGDLVNELIERRCLVNNSDFFLFIIEDEYGDGICCNWGEGTFSVQFNNEIVVDDDDFLTRKVSCLSQIEEYYVFTVDFEPVDIKFDQYFQWVLLDSNYNLLKDRGKILGETQFIVCVPSQLCAVFRSSWVYKENYYTESVPFRVTYNDIIIHEQKANDFNATRVTMGSCNNYKSCPDGYTIFEIDIHIGKSDHLIEWILHDDKNTILARGDNYTISDTTYYHQHCVAASADECLTFLYLEKSEIKGSVLIDFWWNENYSGVKMFQGPEDELQIGGNCN